MLELQVYHLLTSLRLWKLGHVKSIGYGRSSYTLRRYVLYDWVILSTMSFHIKLSLKVYGVGEGMLLLVYSWSNFE